MEQTEAIGWVRNVLLLTGILSLAVGHCSAAHEQLQTFPLLLDGREHGHRRDRTGHRRHRRLAAVFHVVCHTMVKSSLFLQMAVVRRIYNGYRINRIVTTSASTPRGHVGLLVGMACCWPSRLAVLRLGGDALPRGHRRRTVVAGRCHAPVARIVIYSVCYACQTLLPAQSGRTAPRTGTQRPVVGGFFAAGRSDGRRHLAARAASTTHRSNRFAIMHYYVTDNRAVVRAVSENPDRRLCRTLRRPRGASRRRTLPHRPLLRAADGDVLRPTASCWTTRAPRTRRSYAIGYYDSRCCLAPARHAQAHPSSARSPNATASDSRHAVGQTLRSPSTAATAAVRSTTTLLHDRGGPLHEVNVGPIHAGIIETGRLPLHCNGEQVLHLEIALGYQHRGVERTMTADDNVLRQTLVAESIAGDSAVAHATAYAQLREKLAGKEGTPTPLDRERAIALELERMAMHIADTGALCMGRGLSTGAGRLRGAAHRDDQHHAGLVRQPLRQGADPPLRDEPSAHGRDDRAGATQRRRCPPPLR